MSNGFTFASRRAFPLAADRRAAMAAYFGFILIIVGVLLLTPLAALPFWPGESRFAPSFIAPSLLLVTVGFLLWRRLAPHGNPALNRQEGSVIVLAAWVAACLVSAWPLMNISGLTFSQAVFEAVSGYTTTGLSVIDVERAPKVVLLWRSIMQLAGGAGLAIIMLAALTGPAGTGISGAEGRSEQLAPHVRKSAKLVCVIYAGYAVAGTLAYVLCGVNLFDAVNHAFAAISTGGFSTRVASIGFYDSASVEAVTMVLMFLGNLNFLLAYLLVQGKFRAVLRNGEIRLFAALLCLSVPALIFLVCRELYPMLGKSVRVALFEAVSALTTCGFSTVGYTDWNALGVLILVILMMVGGGVCSTAGGIKQYRAHLLLKSLVWEVRRELAPRTAVHANWVWFGEQKLFVDGERVKQAALFVFLYMACLFLGAAILMAHGYGFKESFFEFASSLGTVGLSIGITSTAMPPLALWTETIGMFLGRLEFFVVFVVLADGFSRLKDQFPSRGRH